MTSGKYVNGTETLADRSALLYQPGRWEEYGTCLQVNYCSLSCSITKTSDILGAVTLPWAFFLQSSLVNSRGHVHLGYIRMDKVFTGFVLVVESVAQMNFIKQDGEVF